MADEGKKEVVAKATYYVENTVRRVGTRLHRARSATRHRFKIFIGGQRLLRNKKLPLTEEAFKFHEARIKELILAGKVALHMPDGTRITSSPDGKLIYTRKDGAVRVGEAPAAPKPAPKKAEAAPPPPPEVEVVETQEPDDLTILPGIGAGRARKLEAEGIFTFQSLVEAGPEKLASILGVTEEVAAEVVAAASEQE